MPFVIGIAGGTGAGKTTIARALAHAVPAEHVAAIEHDHYYRDLRHLSPEARDRVNFDHPDALESDLLVEHLVRLRRGEPIEVPIYDFATHTRRTETRAVEPSPVVLVEGILVLADAALREQLDLKVYVDTDADIRVLRRIARDLHERARSFESVREQYYATVRPMHLQFVEPSKRWADVIIPEGGSSVALDLLVTKLRSMLPA
jgi:uridine kinase